VVLPFVDALLLGARSQRRRFHQKAVGKAFGEAHAAAFGERG
jgi:hypothetical protein